MEATATAFSELAPLVLVVVVSSGATVVTVVWSALTESFESSLHAASGISRVRARKAMRDVMSYIRTPAPIGSSVASTRIHGGFLRLGLYGASTRLATRPARPWALAASRRAAPSPMWAEGA